MQCSNAEILYKKELITEFKTMYNETWRDDAVPGRIQGGWALFRTGVISDGRYQYVLALFQANIHKYNCSMQSQQ